MENTQTVCESPYLGYSLLKTFVANTRRKLKDKSISGSFAKAEINWVNQRYGKKFKV